MEQGSRSAPRIRAGTVALGWVRPALASSRPRAEGSVLAPGAFLARTLAEEAEQGRIALWAPVAFGSGVLLYFALPREPALWALLALLLPLSLAAHVTRRSMPACLALAGLALAAAGLLVAKLRTDLVTAPVLVERHGPLSVEGTVVTSERREKSVRLVLDEVSATGIEAARTPRRLMLSWRGAKAVPLRAGERVRVRAVLMPPPGPVIPGAYHHARDLFFRGIGGSGFILGEATLLAPHEPGLLEALGLAVARVRAAVTARIVEALPGEAGAVAAALLTGERAQIPEETNEALRASGLFHILSISGMHMALFAGMFYVGARFAFAAVPAIALRHPTRKWAAVLGMIGATGYVLLSGGSVPATRAFVMILIMFAAILADRRALTMRNVALAALAVLAFRPESALSASFQMSFAATIALIAAYETWAGRVRGIPDEAWLGRLAGPLRYVFGLATTSLVAGSATALFGAYHFHTLQPYGLAGNLMAMPVIGLVVMPMGLLGVLAIPFGLEPVPLAAMGWGLDRVLSVARWVASWEGAVVRMPGFSPAVLLAAAASGLWLCLWSRPWRLAGAAGLGVAAALAVLRPVQPDVLVEADGRTMAVRQADGRLAVAGLRSGRFAAERWLEADGDVRPLVARDLAQGLTCDASACSGRIRDRPRIALVLDRTALRTWCGETDILVSPWVAPRNCAARTIIDRFSLTRGGAHALTWMGEDEPPVLRRALNADRPWDRAAEGAAARLDERLRQGLERWRKSRGEGSPPEAEAGPSVRSGE